MSDGHHHPADDAVLAGGAEKGGGDVSGTVKLTEMIARLTRERDEARAEVERLRKCCTQRGARMQIMRREMDWWHFCYDHPEAHDWFDEDGVPVDAAREGE